ncbi:MAG: SMI1/KNR4 family protein [Limisphaerales bacterium]
MNRPLSAAALARFRKRNPQTQIPGDLIEVLKLHNGFGLFPYIGTPDGMMGLYALDEIKDFHRIQTASNIPEEDYGLTEQSLAVAQEGNGDEYIIFDPERGYRLIQIGWEEQPEIGRTVAEVLDYLAARFLPQATKQSKRKQATARPS